MNGIRYYARLELHDRSGETSVSETSMSLKVFSSTLQRGYSITILISILYLSPYDTFVGFLRAYRVVLIFVT